MKIIEICPREKGFVLWGHCQNLLDDPRRWQNEPSRVKTCYLHLRKQKHHSNSALERSVIYHRLNDGDITLVFFPGSPLRSTKEGKFGYVPGRDGSQLPPVYPAIL